MNTHLAVSQFLVSVSILTSGLYISVHAQEPDFFISPGGNDAWSGKIPTPNRANTDGPFASFERAAQAVRMLKQRANTSKKAIVVATRGGTYAFSKTLRLTADDSGTDNVAVVWRAYRGETVHITGARTISGFKKISDDFIHQRIDDAFRDSILVVDLRGQGVTDFGGITARGGPGIELFFQGKRMIRARWPNAGWLRIADVPQTGEKLLNKGLEREKRFDGVPVGRHYGRIPYDSDRPTRWRRDENIYLHGYWTWDWSDSYQRIESVDTTKREITLAEPHHHYGYTKDQRYYSLNILEELDAPGEWYIDVKAGLLYFWPPAPITEGSVAVSMLNEPLIALEGTEHVTFIGFRFQYSRSHGIVVTGGSHNLVAGCIFQYLGNDAVVIEGGTANGVQSCDISDVALGAIRLTGGRRSTLQPADNFAANNHIHHYSNWVRTGQYAVVVDGVGNRVQHNLIHDAPHEAIYLRGNDHLIEFNEIYRVCQETGDAGALHTGRDWTWRGNVIRYNYFHDLQGPGLHGAMAVYLDDWSSGFTVFGNIFYRSGRSAFIGGGRDNLVENNIFVECRPSVHIDARGLGWAGYYFDGTRTELFDLLKEMKYHEPPYSTRYPELLTLDDGEPAIPKNNTVVRNVSYGGRWLDIYDYLAFDFSVVTMKDNVIADPDLCRRRQEGQTGWDPYYLDIDRKDGYVLYRMGNKTIMDGLKGNVFLRGNPGFVNVHNGDFRLKADSPAYRLGFKSIPIEKIGLLADRFRPTLPRRTP